MPVEVEVKTGVPVPEKTGKLGRWKEIAQGMEVDGPGVLLKGETARSNAARCLRAASKTLGYKVKSQTTAEGVVVWRVE